MVKCLGWLMGGEPYIEYPVRLWLLGESPNSQDMQKLYKRMEGHPLVAGLLHELSAWESDHVSNHKNPSLLYHKLNLLADTGMTARTQEIAETIGIALRHLDAQGVPRVLVNVPKHFGGTGTDEWGWALCDAPVVLYSLLKLGVKESLLAGGIAYLASLCRENGWPCAVSPELGKFRGPGRKDDPCPYATLRMVKLLQASAAWRDSGESRLGAEAILGLWERSREEHPYMFYMGTDFRKLKAPLSWYDVVSVADALSMCPWARGDMRFGEILDCIAAKADGDGRFTPESVYLSMKDWDFGQKKEPSRGLTACIHMIYKRLGMEL
jgi:hypothetical protein